MKVISPSNYKDMPWKNGLGVTTELIRIESDQGLKLRISTAKVDTSGPFSHFPGLHRTLINCGPGTMRLTIDGSLKDLLVPWAQVQFDGHSETSCEIDRPLIDINVFSSSAECLTSTSVNTIKFNDKGPVELLQ